MKGYQKLNLFLVTMIPVAAWSIYIYHGVDGLIRFSIIGTIMFGVGFFGVMLGRFVRKKL